MNKKTLQQGDVAILILISAILFGGIFRLLAPWLSGFPINDGGMFYTTIQDILSNRYIPPHTLSYNNGNIPFAYPPLGFYLGAVLTDLLNLPSPIGVLQWLPAILNILCLPAFYLFAREILEDAVQAAIATLVLALTPHMTAWFSMGGGLTRALGAFFMLLTLANAHRVFSKEETKAIWGTILFGGLTALSHTEAPVYTIALASFLWLAKSRTLKGLLHAGMIAVGVCVMALPWYGWVIANHGVSPFLAAGQSGFHTSFAILRVININYLTEEPYLGLLGTLGVLGMALLISEKKYLIPGMLLIIFLSNPRSAHTVGNIPLAMASGYFIGTILLSGISNLVAGHQRNKALFMIVLIPYLFSNSTFYAFQLAKKHLSSSEREAMQWVAANTPTNSQFLVISGEPSVFCDAVSEWFPALSNRQSLATLQGHEWTKGKTFEPFLINTISLQACLHQGLECILEESKSFTPDFTHLYLSLDSPTQDCNLTNASGLTRSLVLELERSDAFDIVFQSDSTYIFVKK